MSFRVNARTILQLGSELISSDGIAFYELVKNAVDAKSPRVEINVTVALPYSDYQSLLTQVRTLPRTPTKASLSQIRTAILEKTVGTSEEQRSGLLACSNADQLTNFLETLNCITITDLGVGMSLEELDEVFLTIGTRSRQRHRGEGGSDERPFLGEKGIGRLSAMRLGERLEVRTAKATDRHWNILSIDWRVFSHNSDALLQDIDISPERGAPKRPREAQGTTLFISALTSPWTEDKLKDISITDFSRLTDPFSPASRFRIVLRFNGSPIPIASITRDLLNSAHASCRGKYVVDRAERTCYIEGHTDYTLRGQQRDFHVRDIDLMQLSGVADRDSLISLGPFTFEWYWFNRRVLSAVDGIGDRRTVAALVERWGGGVMLFRDGFRVNPYGSQSDDWIKLDASALASQGYKVNRKQIVGKVDISSRRNPNLTDQTNREGLRDCSEKDALVEILNFLLTTEFRGFLTRVDDAIREREQLDFSVLEERLSVQEDAIDRSLARLLRKYPDEQSLVLPIRQGVTKIREVLSQAKEVAATYEDRQAQLFNLAGIGLITEIVAHELNRAVIHTLELVQSLRAQGTTRQEPALLALEQQLKTLQKRVRAIDPVSTSGRQHKEHFDAAEWIRTITQSHENQFRRHGIAFKFRVIPPNAALRVYGVRGMYVQVFENLISNSVYWLAAYKRQHNGFQSQIEITVDTIARTVSFTDNGPGIEPYRAEDVFQPFVTTKPPRKGKGLGLYVAREIARYNDATLDLSDEHTIRPDALNTFILAVGDKE